MLTPLLALVTTAALGLLLGRFLSDTYGTDPWPSVALAAFPVIAALVLVARPMNARMWLSLTAFVGVNIGLGFPFLALLVMTDEHPPDGLAQMAAMALAAGLASIIALVSGVRHLRRIGLDR